MLPWALGHGLAFKEGEGPVLPLLRDAAGVAALRPARVAGRVAPIMETVRLVRAGLSAEGFADTTSDRLCRRSVHGRLLYGGRRGSRDFAATRAMACSQPDLFGRLMDVLTEASIESLGPGAGRRRGPDAVRFMGRRAVTVAVPQACHCPGPADRRGVEAALPGLPVIGFPGWRAS